VDNTFLGEKMSLLKKLGMSLASVGLACALNLESKLYAGDIHVPTKEHPTIQTGIDAAVDRDSVLVAPGEYIIREPITYRGKNIIVKSKEGAKNTIVRLENPIDSWYASVFVFENGETRNAILEGFSITGGKGILRNYLGATSIWGGGIHCQESSPTIRNNFITKNYAEVGGAIACINSAALIKDNSIFENVAGRSGGGIHCDYASQPIIQKNIISGNLVQDEWGGGIVCLNNSLVTIKDNIIISNYARELGGGVCLWGAEATLENNIITKNNTNEHGGGIAGIYSILNVMNNTIVNNTTEYMGGGIHFVHEDGYGYNGFLTVLNNIIWNNEGDSELSIRGPFIVAYNNISKSDFCSQNGNISLHPLFANPNNNNYHLKSQAGRYDPNSQKWVQDDKTSPCIDAGDPKTPIMYEPFPNGGRINMGAYGGTKEASKSYFGLPLCKTIVAGDINGDCKVDFKDFAIMARHWLERGP